MDLLSSKDTVIFHEVVESIDKDIATLGFSTICTNPKLIARGQNRLLDNSNTYQHLNDMVICTVGFSLLGYPELMFMAGPVKGELPINEETLYSRTWEILEYIKETIAQTKKDKVSPIEGATAVNIDGRMYSFNEPSPAQVQVYLKTSPLAECYYDYKGIEDLLIVLPMFSDDLSHFKHNASKSRH